MEAVVSVKLFLILLISVAQTGKCSKIIGGETANEGQFPYQVSIQCMRSMRPFKSNHMCGGVLYNHRTVITSGYCCKAIKFCPLDELSIVAGEVSLNEISGNEQTSTLERMLIHPGYSYGESEGVTVYYNDICLMITGTNFEMTSSVSNLTLGETEDCTPGLNCSLSGWTKFDGMFGPPDYLKFSTMQIVNDRSCQTKFPYYNHSQMLCAGQEKVEMTDGDSGGPLACKGKLCGIASFTYYGDDKAIFYYTFFTRVSSYLDWIKENAEDAYATSTTTTTTTPATSTASIPGNKTSIFELIIVFAVLMKTFYA